MKKNYRKPIATTTVISSQTALLAESQWPSDDTAPIAPGQGGQSDFCSNGHRGDDFWGGVWDNDEE